MSNLANPIIPLIWLSEWATTPMQSSEHLSLLLLQSLGQAYSLSTGRCLELLVAILPKTWEQPIWEWSLQMENTLEEGQSWGFHVCIWIQSCPIVQLCEPIKSLCWLMTVTLDLSHFWQVPLWCIPFNCNIWHQMLKNKATFWKITSVSERNCIWIHFQSALHAY